MANAKCGATLEFSDCNCDVVFSCDREPGHDGPHAEASTNNLRPYVIQWYFHDSARGQYEVIREFEYAENKALSEAYRVMREYDTKTYEAVKEVLRRAMGGMVV